MESIKTKTTIIVKTQLEELKNALNESGLYNAYYIFDPVTNQNILVCQELPKIENVKIIFKLDNN